MLFSGSRDCRLEDSGVAGRHDGLLERPAVSAGTEREASGLALHACGKADARSATDGPAVAVIIVGFHNPEDIGNCLWALSRLQTEPRFEVFIAENGGAQAMDTLNEALAAANGPCRRAPVSLPSVKPSDMPRQSLFWLIGDGAGIRAQVNVAEMPENLGYAGAINAWLRPLLLTPDWQGVWILNPDTQPTPSALAELFDYAIKRGKGMVGSRITVPGAPDYVRTRGLAWNKLRARTTAVDYGRPAAIEPDPDDVEARLDAPSGSSIYVTREMIERIGLMEEGYFLFFEDLEWGYRAKAIGGLGHAHRSVVPHEGGTTIRSAAGRTAESPLAVYLEFRNRITFVRERHRAWLPWTVLVLALQAAALLAGGAIVNTRAACRGLAAGLKGEVGRPDRILKDHAR
jgi:N-acetylglucosaminyl-diphospho-decaprenol L-rhamnosyltransferase